MCEQLAENVVGAVEDLRRTGLLPALLEPKCVRPFIIVRRINF